MAISAFSKRYHFLSNFYLCNVLYEGIKYPSSENAYQAAKTTNKLIRRRFIGCSPSESKLLGREVKMIINWDDTKTSVMEDILRIKFSNPELRKMLINTGTEELIEGNYWHDNFWGDCTCHKCLHILGKNQLGKILMKLRDEMK